MAALHRMKLGPRSFSGDASRRIQPRSHFFAVAAIAWAERRSGETRRAARATTGAAEELEDSAFHARASSDSPRLHAFCRVAFSVRLRVLAMSLAGRFRFASDFILRTSSGVQRVLLKRLFIAKQSPVKQLR